jgi:hypothetical protein
MASGGGLGAFTKTARENLGMKNGSDKHKVGTREEWLATRLKLLKAEKEHTLGAVTSWRRCGSSCLGFGLTKTTSSKLMRGRLPSLTSFEAARSF